MFLSFRQLEGYELRSFAGSSSLSSTWRAIQPSTGAEVAVRVFTAQRAREPDIVEALRRQLRAVSSLEHPHILRVYSWGLLPEALAEASGGDLVAGSPWVAEELVHGGVLSTRCGSLGWSEVCRVLLEILDGLAHAHARGVLHRDLRPETVRLDQGGAARLVDLGLVHALGREGSSSGTPAFMAPEQLTGGDKGPWTDLYALGCLAWTLVTGSPPHGRGRPVLEVEKAHLAGELPLLEPIHPTPEGLADWLSRLLDPDPERRPRSAAEATLGLLALPRVQATDRPVVVRRRGRPEGRWTLSPLRMGPEVPGWRGPSEEEVVEDRHPLTTSPLVGRSSEQDLLWAALTDTIQSGSTRCVVVRGGVGLGASRLASWIGTRAHELGLAHALSAFHGPEPWAREVLAELVAPLLRGGEVASRWLSSPARQPDAYVPAGPEERWSWARRLLTRDGRPVVAWLDDVQWGVDTQGFVRWFLEGEPAPVLFVLTVRDDLLQESEALRLESLLATPGVWRLDLAPLAPTAARQLAHHAVAGPGQGGVPLVLVHQARGGPDPNEPGGRPVARDVAEVLDVAVRSAFAELRGDQRQSIAVAAAIGVRVGREEWVRACGSAGIPAAEDTVDALVAAGQAVVVPQGWAFAHAELRRAWRDLTSTRPVQIARACASAFEDPARRGWYLLEANAWSEALEPLAQAAEEARSRGVVHGLVDWAAARERALRALEVPRTDASWGLGWLLRAEFARGRGDLEVAEGWAGRVVGVARAVGEEGLLARALLLRADLSLDRERLIDATALVEEAASLSARRGDHTGLALALMCIGRIARRRGELDATLSSYDRASALLEGDGEELLLARCLLDAGVAARVAAEDDRAEVLLEHARSLFRRHGAQGGIASASAELGDLAASRGAHGLAEDNYERAVRALRASGSSGIWRARLNLGLLKAARGQAEEAARLLQGALDPLERGGHRGEVGAVHAALVLSSASRGEWEAWDRHLWQARRRLAGSGLVLEEVARIATLAGELAAGAGDGRRAAEAWGLALGQWRALGRTEEANDLQGRLDSDLP